MNSDADLHAVLPTCFFLFIPQKKSNLYKESHDIMYVVCGYHYTGLDIATSVIPTEEDSVGQHPDDEDIFAPFLLPSTAGFLNHQEAKRFHQLPFSLRKNTDANA